MRDEIILKELTQDLPRWKEGDQGKIIERIPLLERVGQIFTKDTIVQDHREKAKDIHDPDPDRQKARGDIENLPV